MNRSLEICLVVSTRLQLSLILISHTYKGSTLELFCGGESSAEPNGAFGFGRHEMAEQILIGQTCHVAIEVISDSPSKQRGGKRKEGRDPRSERSREGGNRKRRNFTHIVALLSPTYGIGGGTERVI